MLKIIDKIKKENIFEGVTAGDKEEVLKIISEKAASLLEINGDELLEELKKREEDESTGIGHSVAIPHAKITGVSEPAVFIFILEEDIDFEALDGQYVKIIFLLIADKEDTESYVTTLSQLNFLLAQKNIMEKILDAESVESFMEILTEEKELEEKYEHEGQIKYLVELQRAESQIYMFELWEAQQEKHNETLLEEYKKYRDILRGKISEDVITLYERIAEKYNGKAMAKIENYTCSACHIAIPKVTVNEVRRKNQIISCFNCGRILFTID